MIGIAVVLLLMLNSPMATAAKSLSNVGDEFNQRLQGSPLESVGMLMNSLESGSLTVDFDYRDRWSDARGVVTLHSDERRGDYAVESEIIIDGQRLDFDFYINRERAAVRVEQFDRNFYGINFATFRSDFRSFADNLGLSRQEIDMIADMVDFISEMMNVNLGSDALYAEYQKIIEDFFRQIEFSSERVEITSGGSSVRATAIELQITDRMIIKLFEDILKAYENDESMRQMFDAIDGVQSTMNPWSSGSSYDEMLREMRSMIRELERELRGDILVTLFVGRRDRLLRLEIDANLEFDRERTRTKISLDFGSSARDTWVLEMNTDDETYIIEWEINESSRGAEIILRFTEEYRNWSESFEITLDWSDRGDFTLSHREGRERETLLSGTYTSDRNGFRLTLDDPFVSTGWGETLHLEISTASRSGRIPQIDFINVSEWDLSLIDKLEDFIYSFDGGSSSGSALPMPTPPTPSPGETYAGLIGAWEFSYGDATYFFWRSDFVEFYSDGWVFSDDEGREGVWTVQGDRLTVETDFGVYHYTFELVGDTLIITDHDNDTGVFIRLW